jgi:hypothetical protein
MIAVRGITSLLPVYHHTLYRVQNLHQNSIKFGYNVLSALQFTTNTWEQNHSDNFHIAETFTQQQVDE